MASTVEDLKAAIESRGADWLIAAEMAVDGLSLTVALDHIVEVLTFLREDPACDFSTLTDITAVDWPGRAVRFEMVYHMLSMHQNHRIRVKADVPEGVMVPSVVGIWPSANWYEREVFDMYGVLFTGHPDLRRILTDYGFSGFPLRKDFPTTGYVEVRYDEEAKSVVYEPVELTQEYRQFDFMSPWEGAEYILPGDEKKEA